MPYVCLKCNEVYKSSINQIKPIKYGENKEWMFCPKINCHGEVVEIDELIMPTIIELNKKDYTTEFCCSGHSYERYTNTYISFTGEKIPMNLPKGFIMEKIGDKFCIRKYYDNISSKLERFEEILKTNLELLKWANNL